MKKIIAIICVAFVALTASAQSTTPRYGSGANNDNTGRALTYKYVSLTDASGSDSVTINPAAWETIYRVALVDSFYFKTPNVTRSFAGDRVVVVASGASGTKVKFANTNLYATGTATLSAVGRAIICFIFDGAKWVEVSRTIQ